MAITLRTPSHNLNRWFVFEITSAPERRIQIRSIQENGIRGDAQNSARPPDNTELGNPFYYRLEAIRDLYLWLGTQNENDGWVILGSAGEENQPNAGTVEAWARTPNDNWYGISTGQRGRFATFIPPILE